MKPETQAHIDNADAALRRGQACMTLLSAEPLVAEDVARAAYYAAFHAAKALLFERSGGSSKKHGSVHRAFENITIGDASINDDLRRFLAKNYELKLIGDYGVSPSRHVTVKEARDALTDAVRFVATVKSLLP